MAYAFGRTSKVKLETCHPDLQRVAELVMSWQVMDFTIVWGHRDADAQEQAFRSGNSRVRWPNSRHNSLPCTALDFAPYFEGRIPWDDEFAFCYLAGLFKAAAAVLGIDLTWGGDWDSDGSTQDTGLMDLGHVELKNP